MDRQDSEQLARLWTESQPIVSAYVLSMIPSFHQAEDVLQQVAVVLVREFDKYDAGRPFLPWALGIARNVAQKSRRDSARGSRALWSETVLNQIQGAFEESEEEWTGIRALLRECLLKLPEKILELLQWRYAYDLKPGEIAIRMGITSGAVRVMLHRARGSLRKCIKRRSHGVIEWQ
jgi:RNA polymerase sigma-70 factor (ECF subfamily)